MADWFQLVQSVVIGLIFSYLLAKLISIVVAFKDDNLSVTRHHQYQSERKLEPASRGVESSTAAAGEGAGVGVEADSVLAEQSSFRTESVGGGGDDDDDDDDDDWEGVESTELDEAFSAATAFVAAAAADRLSQKLPNDIQLQLYGLYKIATEGPCSAPQPSALKMTARAKLQAWQKLGAMPPEEAMEKYIDIVTELYPNWAAGAAKGRGHGSIASSSDAKGPMGPVFSSFVYEEESGNDLNMDAIHAFAREGEVENLLKCIDSGVPVNARDSEGRIPLHWAIDRGHLNVAETLINKNADINAKDNEGQTPLHYAATCDREDIAKFLLKQNADTTIKDNDGNSFLDVCEADWPWIQDTAQQTT